MCQRCGYKAGQKSEMVSHLQRKRPCEPRFESTDPQTLLQQIRSKKGVDELGLLKQEINCLKSEFQELGVCLSEIQRLLKIN
jgi:hypothetical protein